MPKWIKWVLLGIVGLLIIVLVSGYAILIANKQKVHELITETFNKELRGELVMKKIDFTAFERFPSFTIRIEDIFITDSASAVRGDTLLTAGRISIGVDILRLLTGGIKFNSIKISDADIYMVKDSSGRMNTPKSRKVKVASGEKKKASIPTMKRIDLVNFSFHLIDSVRGKKYGLTIKKAEFKTESGSSPISYRMDAAIHFDGLVFNPVKGGYLTDQDIHLNANVGFDPEESLLRVTDGLLNLKGQYLLLNAEMNFAKKSMDMRFDASSVLPDIAFAALTPAIQSKLSSFHLEKPVIARVYVKGFMTPGYKPAVDVYFKATDNRLTSGARAFEHLNLLGWFTSHIDSTKINDDHNSKLVFPKFDGMLYGLPLKAMVQVTDLKDPALIMDAHIRYDEKQHGETTTERFRFMHGVIDIKFLFSGPLARMVDTVNHTLLGELKGGVIMQNADFDQLSNGYEFRNVNASITIRKPDAFIDSMSLSLNGNKIRLGGYTRSFIASLIVPGQKAYAGLDISADVLDLGSFASQPSAVKKEVKEEKKEKKKGGSGASGLAEWIGSDLEFDVNINANKIIIGDFSGTNVKAILQLANNRLQITNAGMSTCGGEFKITTSISEMSSAERPLVLNSSIKNVQMSALLTSFNNFGQSTVTGDNISGTLSCGVALTGKVDKEFGIIGNSLNGRIGIKLRDGSLKDVEALEKIGKNVFKNRDFSNVEFADIKSGATVTGMMLKVDTLNVLSSVLTLLISGVYDFDKVNTDLVITIPFSNLKKMEASERMSLSDSALKKGANVLLRATNDKNGEIKVSPTFSAKPKDKGDKEAKTPKKEK